jgi:hypothetical protein
MGGGAVLALTMLAACSGGRPADPEATTAKTGELVPGSMTFRITKTTVAPFVHDTASWDFVDFKTTISGTQTTTNDLFHCTPGGPSQERFQPCTENMTYYFPTSSEGRCPPTTSPVGSLCYVKDRTFTNPAEFAQFAHTAPVDLSASIPISVQIHETSDDHSFPDEHFSFNLSVDPATKTITPGTFSNLDHLDAHCATYLTQGWVLCWDVDFCTPEVFDGVDNDCDGIIDNCTAPQSSWDCTVPGNNPAEALCQGLPGRATCSAAGAGQCLPIGPGNGNVDDCNTPDSVDNNCNGQVDEGGPEIPADGVDNDCNGLVDECAPGSTDWRCCSNTGLTSLEFNVVPNTPVNSDPIPAPACVPLSVDPNATCSMRGVFQVAHSTGDNGCTVLGHVAPGTYPTADELRLDRGRLRLLGNQNDPLTTRVTTSASCADQNCAPCAGNDCSCNGLDCTCSGPDCDVACTQQGECGRRTCSKDATHRLVNAIFATNRLTNLLEVQGLTFDGGRLLGSPFSTISKYAAGGIVVDGGAFIGRNVVIADNRTEGLGAGLAVFSGPQLLLNQAVVRDNLNMRAFFSGNPGFFSCHNEMGGGINGAGGGIYAAVVANTDISDSAILRNTAPDNGGGIAVLGSGVETVTMVNNTVAANNAGTAAGGILLGGVKADLRFNTVTENNSDRGRGTVPLEQALGGGISVGGGGSFTAFGNVFAKNAIRTNDSLQFAEDCHVDVTSMDKVTVGGHGFNLIGVGGRDCVALGMDAPGTLIGGTNMKPLDPKLGALTSLDLGARDQVQVPQTGSPAVDAYPLSSALPPGTPACPVRDQRSFVRPPAGQCDLGSVEIEGTLDADQDGIPSPLDTLPLLFSDDFSDASIFGITSGTIVDRGQQTVVVADAPGLQNGVLVAALPGGGSVAAQIRACGGTVLRTLQSGQSTTITCPEAAHSCLFASQALTIKDRSDDMSDFFGGSFSFGLDMVASGNGLSSGNGFLNSRSTILGNATLTGVLSGNRAGVKGVLKEHTAVGAQAITVRSGTSSGADRTIPSGTSSTLTPGAYGNVAVQTGPQGGATLVLATSGLYRFKSLQFDPDTRLSILGGSDVTVLAVDGNLALGDRFKMDSGGGARLQQSQVLAYTNGSAATVGFDTIFTGTIAAPSALVTLQDRSYVSGCVGGKNVTVGFDATIGNAAPVRMCDASNRVNNPGFESGTTGWSASSGAAIAATTSRAHTGTHSGSVTNRTAATQGAVTGLLSTAPQGATYDVSAWAEPSTSTSQPLTLSAHYRCNGGSDQTVQLAQTTGRNTAWTRLAGVLTVPNCPLGALDITVAGPPSGVGLFADDAAVVQRCP